MEDKIMNTVDEVMENNEAMTEVCKNGKNVGVIAAITGVAMTAIGAVVFYVRQRKKRKFEKDHVTVKVDTAETVENKDVEG